MGAARWWASGSSPFTFTDVAKLVVRQFTWCSNKENPKFSLSYDDMCTRQYVSLFSVDSPSISLGDQSRVSERRLARKRVSSLFRVNRLFEMVLVIQFSQDSLSVGKWNLKLDYDNFRSKFGNQFHYYNEIPNLGLL